MGGQTKRVRIKPVVTDLPRTPTGKVLKKKLREMEQEKTKEIKKEKA
jgi:acyl-CoA synthetase (AMP-forming)/AMP-acid ligase II